MTAAAGRVAPEVVCTAVAKTFHTAAAPLVVLEPLNLSLDPGSVTALVGPSGCGKSTLLRIIAGLEQPDPGGAVSIGGDEPLATRRRGELAIAFQDASLLPWRTTAGNVALAQRLAGQPVDVVRIRELLQMVGLGGGSRMSVRHSCPAGCGNGRRSRAV